MDPAEAITKVMDEYEQISIEIIDEAMQEEEELLSAETEILEEEADFLKYGLQQYVYDKFEEVQERLAEGDFDLFEFDLQPMHLNVYEPFRYNITELFYEDYLD